ncbi:putative glycosyl hydrolase [Aspergillus neoniger CBS 115656]|uniref:Glycosyl hydrolase n=1 Tax=Aspergillus neoniger (strain CBS 115656) TaxID=1448310 RepID=A0A318YRA8_ASPNB|nr:glycosyl hydrolase [Aspergillus neoniger CBS 115656]PYH36886.1 glycosyl hydrolase [Aspergillus neoniger CBS 115656]
MNLLLLLSSLLTITTTATTLIPHPGNRITIPTWHIQPTTNTTNPPNTLNLNLTTPDSHSTILATLLHPQNQPNPIIPPYNESALFHSTILSTIPTTPFQSPWLYTTTITVPHSHSNTTIILSTHGISSRGDIFINGAQIGSISGAYNGQEYDISPQLREGVENEVQVKVYPVDYTRDFGVGWADWNPPPPDMGMGVWRGVEVRGVYGVAVQGVRVVVVDEIEGGSGGKDVKVRVRVDVRNWGERSVRGVFGGRVFDNTTDDTSSGVQFAEAVTLRGGEVTTVEAEVTIKNPKIWWPATWGKQDMYTVSANFTLSDGTLSDTAECSFGIRSVTATFTHHGDEKDVSFRVNGYPFHVRGAGYSPDIFLRFDIDRVRTLLQAVLDMGLNTIRLEGKLEHPQFYDLADRMGIMVLAGWECCDKWEAWEYNTDLSKNYPWTNHDYLTATSMLTHTSLTLQPHPSILAFLLGSDYPPNPRAFTLYTTALNHSDWTAPIISSASARIHPSGMKMLGPYDWVPPNYWYGERLGAAYGFGSEQGAGVGTPELPSLRRFLSEEELDRLWKEKNAAMYHMSPAGSQFHTRGVYNAALWGRFGKPTSLEEYVFLAQVVDYEATRTEFEAFAVRQNRSGGATGGNGGGRAATGVVYWMLNSAWPSLHWQLVDYYLRRGGAYYGVKVGARGVHVAVDYESGEVYVVNHGVKRGEGLVVVVDVVGLDGKRLYHEEVKGVVMGPTMSKKVTSIIPWVGGWDGVVFLRLLLKESGGKVLSRNVYTLPAQLDVLDWDESTWYTTPVSDYANFSALRGLPTVEVGVSGKVGGGGRVSVTLENRDKVPAWFVRISMVDEAGGEVDVWWEDNYVSVLGGEKVVVSGRVDNSGKMGIGRMRVVVEGGNVRRRGCYI